MTKEFKPMKGKDIDFKQARWPMFISPKLDGIRALVIDGVVMSYNLKPIPNEYVQNVFCGSAFNGLDGELIVGAPTNPNVYLNTNSGVMSKKGEPNVRFYVFDCFRNPDAPYADRNRAAQKIIAEWDRYEEFMVPMSQLLVHSEEEARQEYESFLELGYEGAMFRDPNGRYKFGRSTQKECLLLKWKPIVDSDAEILSCYEQMHNGNEATIDALGHIKRSSHQANKTGKGTLGGFHCRDVHTGVEFDIGVFKGITDKDRKNIWDNQTFYVGKFIKYSSLQIGVKDRPRHPRVLMSHGFRDQIDIVIDA